MNIIPDGQQISLSDLQNNYGGSNPISISEYYGTGTYVGVGTSGTNGTIPTSGQISFSQFYGSPKVAQRGIFGFGNGVGGVTAITNLISNTGVVANDTAGVGTTRDRLGACGYGGDKAIFAFGLWQSGYSGTIVNVSNLVSSAGVVATDTAGVGTARYALGAASYAGIKGIFAFGGTSSTSPLSISNLVSSTGVVATDTAGVGTARYALASCSYGLDKSIFIQGTTNLTSTYNIVNVINTVSNTGVVANDTTSVGTIRCFSSASNYGFDKAIVAYGELTTSSYLSVSNLISNTGVIANDTAGVGTARTRLAACGYGGDKAIFGYGATSTIQSMTNLVSNTGVVANDTAGVGSIRQYLSAASYSFT